MNASQNDPWLKKNKWYVIGGFVLLVAIADFAYGLTQLSINHQKVTQDQISHQVTIEKERADTLQKQVAEQKKAIETQQSQMNALITSTMNSSHNAETSTIRTVYLPGTDKVTERIETKIIEHDTVNAATSNETHSSTASTSTIETAATTTIQATSTESLHATDTLHATSTVTTTTSVKPANSKAREMRFSVGAIYNDKIKAAATYTVPMFGIPKIVQLGPGLTVGDDLLGASLQADIASLPRFGVGYGCRFNMKECKIFYGIGIRLDM